MHLRKDAKPLTPKKPWEKRKMSSPGLTCCSASALDIFSLALYVFIASQKFFFCETSLS